MNIPKVVSRFKTSVRRKYEPGDATLRIESNLDAKGVAVSGLVGFTINRGAANQEDVLGTLSGTTLTIVNSGIDPQDPDADVSALQFEHERGEPIEITNYPVLGILKMLLNGEEGIPNVLKYASEPTFTDRKHLIDKGYADDLTIAGAPDASETIKGIFEAATQTETDEGDDAGGTTAPLAVRPSVLLQSKRKIFYTGATYGATLAQFDPLYADAADSNKLKKALATGETTTNVVAIAEDAGANNDTNKRVYIPGSLITGLSGLTPNAPVYLSNAGAFATTPGTFKKVVGWALSATSMIFLPVMKLEHLAGLSADVTSAILEEIADVFSATDVTGAELETLTGGGNADTLHTHDNSLQSALSTSIELIVTGDSSITSDLNGGSESFGTPLTSISSNVTGGAAHYLEEGELNSDWGDNHVWQGVFKPSDITARDDFFGMGNLEGANGSDNFDIQENSTLVRRHIAFLFEDGTVYASVADGTTQTKSSALAGFTYNGSTVNKYAIVYTAGVSAKFYVNGVLKATLTTNLPTGSTDYCPLRVGTEGDAGTKAVYYGAVKISIPAPVA